jgi:hypothetical protein
MLQADDPLFFGWVIHVPYICFFTFINQNFFIIYFYLLSVSLLSLTKTLYIHLHLLVFLFIFSTLFYCNQTFIIL